MILIVDNYDSFTFNLAQLILRVRPDLPVQVRRNDEVTLQEIAALGPACILISPGPGRPEEAGLSVQIVHEFSGSIPILGVCLGHQCIAQALGGRVIPAKSLMHGKTSRIYHDGEGLFAGLPSPIEATRYHSLALDRDSISDELKISAWTTDGEIMAIRHQCLPLCGVQFHPESFLTAHGGQMLSNFLHRCRDLQPAC